MAARSRKTLILASLLSLGVGAWPALAARGTSGPHGTPGATRSADAAVLALEARWSRPVLFRVESASGDAALRFRGPDGREARSLTLGPVAPGETIFVEVFASGAERRTVQRAARVPVRLRVEEARRGGRTLEDATRFVALADDRRGDRRDDRRDDRWDDRWDNRRDDRGSDRGHDRRNDRAGRHDHHDHGARFERPRGYETMDGRRVTRQELRDLPLRVHPGSSQYRGEVREALALWNDAARQARLTRPFVLVDSPRGADLVLDWSGRGVDPGHGAVTDMDFGRREIVINRVAFERELPARRARRVLVIAHELGHVLGLGTSDRAGDLMGPADRAALRSHHVRLAPSRRDVEMLGWLYGQRADLRLRLGPDAHHVRPGRRVGSGSVRLQDLLAVLLSGERR